MAFEKILIALSWRQGKYSVVSQTDAQVDEEAIDRKGLFHDVSENSSYVDEMAVFEKKQFARYLLRPADRWTEEAKRWYDALPEEASFIIVHRAEWESYLDD